MNMKKPGMIGIRLREQLPLSSFEEKYYLANPTFTQRLRRDARMVVDSARFLILWATLGRRLRAAVKEAERSGSQLVLEDWLSSQQR